MVGEMTLVASHLKIYISPVAKRNGPWTVGIPVMEGCLKKIPAMYKSRIRPIDEKSDRIVGLGVHPKQNHDITIPNTALLRGNPSKLRNTFALFDYPQNG